MNQEQEFDIDGAKKTAAKHVDESWAAKPFGSLGQANDAAAQATLHAVGAHSLPMFGPVPNKVYTATSAYARMKMA